MHNQNYKIALAFVLLITLNFGMAGSVTNAYFSDEASLTGNIFTAGTLDFNLDPSADFSPLPLNKGEATSTSITVVKNGNIDFQYTASTTDMTGYSDLCDYMTLKATLNGVSVYDGSLSGFSAPARSYADPSVWNFVVTLPSDASDSLQDKTCNFKLQFKGWQTDLPSTEGFNDTHEINVSVTSAHLTMTPPTQTSDVVLNEFLPNPDGPKFGDDSSHAPYGEWIELYNNNPEDSVDLNGWYIRDAANNNVTVSIYNTYDFALEASSTVIAPHGWLVVYMNKSFLNNLTKEEESETIMLYNGSQVVQDSYTYALPADYCNLKPTEGETNDEKGSGVGGGCTSPIPGNKSYARIPDGTGAWVDPVPTPGMPNELLLPQTQAVLIGGASSPANAPEETVQAGEPVSDQPSSNPAAGGTEQIPDTTTENPAVLPEKTDDIATPPLLGEGDGKAGLAPEETFSAQEPAAEPNPAPAESPAPEVPISE